MTSKEDVQWLAPVSVNEAVGPSFETTYLVDLFYCIPSKTKLAMTLFRGCIHNCVQSAGADISVVMDYQSNNGTHHHATLFTDY